MSILNILNCNTSSLAEVQFDLPRFDPFILYCFSQAITQLGCPILMLM